MQDDSDDFKSKSQIKREMTALTQFANELIGAGHARIENLGFPDNVLKAIEEGEKIKAHGGRKRQIKFVGKLLRGVDESIIEAARASLNSDGLEDKQREKRITQFRDRLISEGDAAMGDLLAQYPHADRQQMRQLARKAAKEAAQEINQGAGKALLRELRRLDQENDETL